MRRLHLRRLISSVLLTGALLALAAWGWGASREAAKQYIESVGGKLHGFWYGFGSHDGYTIWEAPDNVSLAAVALAISAGGAVSSFETTVLMSVEETLDALKKAGEIKYKTPGS